MSAAHALANPDSQPYWDAAGKGKLIFKTCRDCGHVQFPPRHLCPQCWSENLQWRDHDGKGTIHSLTTVHRAPTRDFPAPYVLALLDLDQGPRMMANLVGPEAAQARIGDRVEVVFEMRGDIILPQFRPAAQTGGDTP